MNTTKAILRELLASTLCSVEYFSSICNGHVGAGTPLGICLMIQCFVASPITVYQCFFSSPHLEPSVAVSLHDYEKNNAKVSHRKHWPCCLVSFKVYQFVCKTIYYHSRKNHLRQGQGVYSRPKKGVPRPYTFLTLRRKRNYPEEKELERRNVLLGEESYLAHPLF